MNRPDRLMRWLLVALLCALSPILQADVPRTLTYQGTLTDSTGQPVNGSKSITFRLYSVPTGGTAFWTETQTVPVAAGRLSVTLGAITANPLNPAAFTGETYIGIQVGTDAEMTRQKLTSVAYAFSAGSAPESDPQVGQLTNGKWCTSNGTTVNCTSDLPPIPAEKQPVITGCTPVNGPCGYTMYKQPTYFFDRVSFACPDNLPIMKGFHFFRCGQLDTSNEGLAIQATCCTVTNQ